MLLMRLQKLNTWGRLAGPRAQRPLSLGTGRQALELEGRAEGQNADRKE